jgi:hypothetical protein
MRDSYSLSSRLAILMLHRDHGVTYVAMPNVAAILRFSHGVFAHAGF